MEGREDRPRKGKGEPNLNQENVRASREKILDAMCILFIIFYKSIRI